MDRTFREIQSETFSIVQKFLLDSGNDRAARLVSLEASLERDLGIGSLERAELFHRIEKSFGIRLPDPLMAEAKNVNDLISAVQSARPPLIQSKQMQSVYSIGMKQTNPASANTLVELLQLYATDDAERPHIYLQDEKGEEEIIRYGALYERSKRLAMGLIQRGLKAGETVAIMLPTSGDFFYTFFGTLLAGGIPVPIYPPFRAAQIDEYAKREALILRNASVRFLVTFQSAEGLSRLLKTFIPSLIDVTTVAELSRNFETLPEFFIEAADPALIQYTSGSTGNPKGVLLNHRNLLTNIRAYGEVVGVRPHDVVVSWLPLYHDMGLIGAWLGSLYYGIPLTLMSPLTFLARPERWLWAIHYHRATISAGPNFAYELCIKKIDEADIEGLDLSSWRMAANGSEMVYPKTMQNFIKRFGPYGFNKKAFFPTYGLAENSLALTFPPLDREVRIDRIQRKAFEEDRRAIPASLDEKKYYEFVSCGRVIRRHEIRVVDDDDLPLKEREVGNIQFRGPSAMQGYYRNPEATEAIFHKGWWDTGDLGYLSDDELFITGRKKDLIIKAGRNYFPSEIEEMTSLAKGVRKGCVAAFGVNDESKGTEKLIIVAETTDSDKKKHAEIHKEIVDIVVLNLGIPPDEVILVPPRSIPKTSSGKLRRSSCKQDYVSGKLGRRGLPVQMQIAKLWAEGFGKKTRNRFTQGIRLLFTLWVGLMALCVFGPACLAIKFLPKSRSEKILNLSARWIFRLCFIPMKIKGAHHVNHASPMIYVANHASYIDPIILEAILPIGCNFVGKKELRNIPILGMLIKKMGYLTVDRLDFIKSAADAKAILEVLKSNRSVVIFPEGTFNYATGVRPFKSGAFKIAAENKIPICPISIKGARKILRDGKRLFTPGRITVTICEPLVAEKSGWDAVVHMREASRQQIAQHSGEQLIDWVSVGVL